ncbi:MAG TPA: alpha/beta hydrolase [Xanthobacteraceae bacterium]|nr:alpha/beta hydrolase [Xanthobacteraceae bacterium]
MSMAHTMAEASATGVARGSFERITVSAADGLKLSLRSYGPRLASTLPVVCLPGLARTAVDFHVLATALAADPTETRWVLALDYRGRGESEYDRNPNNYDLPVELADVMAVLTALEVPPAVFVGTSRGGLLTMMLAAVRPTAIAGAILNDIGPVIDPKGLMRIKSYVGKLPTPRSYDEGADILRRLFAAQFTRFEEGDWLEFAHRTWKDKGGTLVPDYDVKLAVALDGADFEQPVPPLWPQFDALARVPVMVIHGANSDILTGATVSAMRERRHDLDVIEVPDQGHAPVLAGHDLIHRIANFIAFCEVTARH